MKYKNLFQEGKIGSMTVKNRCIMAPMSAALANPDGTVSDELIAYFNARAEGNIGLIMTEYVFVNETGRSSDHQMSIVDDDKIPGLKKLADAVHERGAKIALQLQHGGRRSIVEVTAPSPNPMELGAETPRVYTTEEVYGLIDDFIAGAVRAQKAGYDMVEVHCAHGYLLNDFVSPRANRRTDEFGGTIGGRTRVVTKIIRGIKEACGEDYPVSVRVSADEMVEDGNDPRDSACMCMLFEGAGADLINVSCGVNGVGKGIAPAARENGHNVEAAAEIANVVEIAVAVAGRISEPEYAEFVLRAKKADFVTIGRPLFADPDFLKKAEEGREDEICPCISCLQRCYGNYGHGGVFRSCMVNPFAMRETTMVIKEAEVKKKIVIVGAGPAGLETAWIAAKRGHEVTVYDKNDMPGGQFRIAAVPPHKQLITRAITYYYNMCRKYGVDIQMNTEVTAEMAESWNADIVVLATGGEPLVPGIPGLKECGAVFGSDVLMGAQVKGNKVLVIGGGAQGAETADHLGQYGYDVSIIEMRDGIALDDPQATRELLLRRFKENDVTALAGATVKQVYPDGVDYEKDGKLVTARGFDTIVLSIGVKSYNPLAEQLEGKVKEMILLGDAKKAGNAVPAIYEAAKLGLTIG